MSDPAPITIVGLMSGTSLDGISAAVARFTVAAGAVSAELLHFRTTDYTAAQRERLLVAMSAGTAADYCRLHVDLGAWLGDAARAAIGESGARDVAAVASHGHTIWHEPGHSTWQLGDAASIAERTRLPVISDFRARDVAAGGQGAPLVPAADAALFAPASGWRALQNLGGIGNVTVVPPAGGDRAQVRAFDTGPGVAVIDAVARRFAPHLPYDVDGAMALAGRPVAGVVERLLDAPYFRAAPPKSTGRELFSSTYTDAFVAACYEITPTATPADVVATAVELTARATADAYARFVHEPLADVLLSGGGARNPALVAALERALAPRAVRAFSDVYFDGDAKEAVAFAYLGALHLRGLPGNVPSATGARGPRVLGVLTPA